MTQITFDEHQTTISKDVEQICLEASVLSNAVNTIKNLFPNFLEKLSDNYAQVESIPEVKIKLPKLQIFVVANIDKKQYLDLADLKISVPEGFVGSVCDYVDHLSSIIKLHSFINETTVKPFKTYLSQFICNKDFKLSTNDTTSKYVVSSTTRKTNLSAITHFTRNGTNTQARLGEIISKKADIHYLYKQTTYLTDILAKTDLKALQISIKECVDLLNIIVNQAQSGSMTNVSPEITKNLTMSALQIAEEIEFMSLIHFKALSFVTCVDSLTVVLSDYIKEIH